MTTIAHQRTATAAEQPAGRPIPGHPDALLHTVEAAFLLGLSPRTLAMMRLRGGGPTFCKVTERAVRYRRAVIDTWKAQRERRSTSDPGPRAGAPI